MGGLEAIDRCVKKAHMQGGLLEPVVGRIHLMPKDHVEARRCQVAIVPVCAIAHEECTSAHAARQRRLLFVHACILSANELFSVLVLR